MATVTCTSVGVWLVLSLCVSLSKGGCTFNKTWSGRWFQSGLQNLLFINSTHIETKGECFDYQSDKYLVYNRHDNCYRCLAIHEKYPGVLQYKESICEEKKGSLADICSYMLGDDPLHTMFRKHPETKAITCPFKSAPFTFSYSRGTGECANPPSKAESCTDDSRIVFKYQACPDVPSTESNVEELVCLATWKEGSTRYLIGKISQGNRRNLITDEDQYRCFIYQRDKSNDKTTYSIAQSADATCTGIINSYEGSRTMRLTTVDNHHNRCKFPKWITDHHTWLSLDHKKIYKFTQRNATLKIVDEEIPKPKRPRPNLNMGGQTQAFGYEEFGFESQDQRRSSGEMRVICHAILESQDQKRVQIVAHITSGCDSGYVCMVFYKRDANVIEIQQTGKFEENPDEACGKFNPATTPFTTLVTTTLHTQKCPHLGRYKILGNDELTQQIEKKRKKRDQIGGGGSYDKPPECMNDEYESLTIGCGGDQQQMTFQSGCVYSPPNPYLCHGSWAENGINYIIATPITIKKSSSGEPLRYCFIYTMGQQEHEERQHLPPGQSEERWSKLGLTRVTESCHRHVTPGSGNWAYNFTNTGACEASGHASSSPPVAPALLLLLPMIWLSSITR